MRYFRNIGITTILLAIIFAVGIMVAGGCKESTVPAVSQASGFPDLTKIVALRVGDTDVPLSDVVYNYQVVSLLNQQVIGAAVMKEEARKRGIYPSAEELSKDFEDALAKQGGREQFLKNFPPDLPPEIGMNALSESSLMSKIQQVLIDNEFQAKHGALTQDEINQAWEMNKAMYQQAVVALNPALKPEDVTVEQAMEQIEKQIKDKWMGENAQTFFQDLIKSYPVTNYLIENYKATHPEETEVPLVGVGQPSAGDTGDNPSGDAGGQ